MKRSREYTAVMGEKILVLDSDQESLERTRCMLQKAGYNAVTVEDGFLCLQAFGQERDFAAVLLNEGQGGGTLSGLDVLQRIKDISSDTPVVMSSTSWTPEFLQDCTGVGAFFCMEKTADSDLLLKVLGQAVEEHKLSLGKGKSI